MRQKRTFAFTLVELLVVISIIALLMGILMPYLGSAREQSRRAVCMANLHSIGQAIFLYAHDNDDRLIPGDGNAAWNIWGMCTEKDDPERRSYQPINLGYLISSGLLPLPNDNDHIFFCPSSRMPDGRRPYEQFAGKWEVSGRNAPISYMFNSALDGFGNAVQLGDQPILSHEDKINYLLGDGSVHLFRRTRLEFSGRSPELIQDLSARTGVCFPDIMIHNWLEQDRIDINEATAFINNPAQWMDLNSALSDSKTILVSDIGTKSLVCDVVGAWSSETSAEEPSSHG
ncbi:MAG: type II secretion system protein [Sedimentisphaerales bacterium]|nr:type II secretion system protein [Sedimentisphaerales bacterium]